MNTYELVIRNSQRIETLLKEKFGATGDGMIQQLRSIPGRIPQHLQDSILQVGRIRNQVVHEEGFVLTDPLLFQRTAEGVIGELEALPAQGEGVTPQQEGTVSERFEDPFGRHAVAYTLFVTSAMAFLVAGMLASMREPNLLLWLLVPPVFLLTGVNSLRVQAGNVVVFVGLALCGLAGFGFGKMGGLTFGMIVGLVWLLVCQVLSVLPLRHVWLPMLQVARKGRWVPLVLVAVPLVASAFSEWGK